MRGKRPVRGEHRDLGGSFGRHLADHAGVAPGGPEPWIAGLVLGAMAVLPVWDLLSRRFGVFRVPGAGQLVQHLTLVITFVGAALAARSGTLLTLSTTALLPQRFRGATRVLAAAGAAAICGVLAVASARIVVADRLGGELVALGIPAWWFELVLPAGYAACGAWLV
ncbi:MAG: TRAP transporter small permease, partial [bacterium]